MIEVVQYLIINFNIQKMHVNISMHSGLRYSCVSAVIPKPCTCDKLIHLVHVWCTPHTFNDVLVTSLLVWCMSSVLKCLIAPMHMTNTSVQRRYMPYIKLSSSLSNSSYVLKQEQTYLHTDHLS